MQDIIPIHELRDTQLLWLPPLQRSGLIIYWLVMGIFLSALVSLFYIRVSISVRATGIIRPFNERTEIRTASGGVIEKIYFRDGDYVLKNSLLLTLRNPALSEKQHLNEAEMTQYRDFIHDLDLLTGNRKQGGKGLIEFISPLYRQQALRYYSRAEEQQILLTKAKHETLLNEKLAKDKVISPKEMFDIRIQEQKIISEGETFRRSQFAEWQADLAKYKMELDQCISKREELNQLLEADRIYAPVTGFLQEQNKKYAGNTLSAGDLLYSISPGGRLMGECYVLSKDIGLLKKGQDARFQIDALDYTSFGAATGKILSIDDDYTLLDKSPAFKVKCGLNENRLTLSNGYSGEIKKGMSFRVRFTTCSRTLWQLLYGSLEDRLIPGFQPK